MGRLSEYPTLNAIAKIKSIVQSDADLGGTLFNFTNALTNSTAYRIYDDSLEFTTIKGESFSVWWENEAPYDSERRQQIPIIYIDVAGQNLNRNTAKDNSWKYMMDIIETLELDANLDHSVSQHWAEDILPVDSYQNQIWTFILRCKYRIQPLRNKLYE